MELHLNIPTATSQLTSRQFRFISNLFLMYYSEREFLLKAFLYLSGLKFVHWKEADDDGARWFKHDYCKETFLIEPSILVPLSEKCRFLFHGGEYQPLHWIKMARARHYRLFNATLDEYLMAENYFFAYVETKKEDHLDNLISVLYRYPWQQWNSSKIQLRALKFRTVDPAVKNSVFMWYVGFRGFVPKRCPNLFSGKGSSGKINIRNYINGIIHQLTEGDITRKRNLLKQPAWDALDELEQRAYEIIESERKIKSRQNS